MSRIHFWYLDITLRVNSIRLQDVCGVYECSLHVYFTSITWHESPDVVVMDPGTTEERSSLNFERRSSQGGTAATILSCQPH